MKKPVAFPIAGDLWALTSVVHTGACPWPDDRCACFPSIMLTTSDRECLDLAIEAHEHERPAWTKREPFNRQPNQSNYRPRRAIP